MTGSRSGSQDRFERFVDVTVVITCVLVCGALAARWYESMKTLQAGAPGINVGDSAEAIPGVSFGDGKSTLVLYVRSTCHFCTDSMPFYKRLNNHLRGKSVKLIAVSDEDASVTRAYLAGHGVVADQVVSHK